MYFSNNLTIQSYQSVQCTKMRFASFFSGGFITAIVVNPPERKLEKRTSVQWLEIYRHFSMKLLVKSSVNSVQEAWAKCFVVHVLKFEICKSDEKNETKKNPSDS